MVRYSREDALTDKEFVLLLEGARKLEEPIDLQARFIIMAASDESAARDIRQKHK